MNRLIIINDKHCKEELSALLEDYSADVLLDMETEADTGNLEKVLEGFKELQTAIKEISVYKANQVHKVHINELLVIYDRGEVLEFVLKTHETLTGKGKLADYARDLAGFDFYSLGNQALINLRALDRIIDQEQKRIIMQNGFELSIGSNEAIELMNYLESKDAMAD